MVEIHNTDEIDLPPPPPPHEMINSVNFMKVHRRNIRPSWNDVIHEIKDPSAHLTGNDKNRHMDELAEHAHSIPSPHEMIKLMRFRIP